MFNFAEELKAVEEATLNRVLVPRMLWERILEAIEDHGLLRAMEEAETSELLSREEALAYLEEIEKGEGSLRGKEFYRFFL